MADKYKVVNKHHYRSNPEQPTAPIKFEVGAVMEPTPEELKSFPDRFQKVDMVMVQQEQPEEESPRRGPGRPPKVETDGA